MEISKELIEKYELSDDAVKGLSEYGSSIIANEKNALEQAFKGEANKNAEGILTGAIDSLQKEFGVTIPRHDGEKIKEWAGRALPEVFKTQKSELDKLKSDYETKLKTVSGQDVDKLKSEYQSEKDELLKKYADFDNYKEKAEKADNYEKELSLMKKKVAFGNARPSFPETANQYEVAAKWGDFEKEVLEKYNIEIDEDGNAVYADKENKFKTGKLSDLVSQNQEIQDLLKGRKQGGLGVTKETEEIEGIPFRIDKSKNISVQIKEYLTNNEKLDFTSTKYSERFQEMYKIYKQKTAA